MPPKKTTTTGRPQVDNPAPGRVPTAVANRITQERQAIIDRQVAKLQEKGKYQHEPEEEVEADMTRSVTEYVTPTGGVGVDIIYKREVEGGHDVRVIAVGSEKAHRELDWTFITSKVF